MLSRDDLIDLIMGHLRQAHEPATRPARAEPFPEGPRGRPFLTEHEIKKRLAGGAGELKVPKDAILSPLAQEWLVLKGVKIIRQD